MRNCIVILFASIFCLAQSQPKISLYSTYYDFGKIRGDQKAYHYFMVTNKGQSALNITRLNPSCGCTSTMVDKWTLAPNESTNIKVTLDTTGLCGAIKKSVRVISNDPIHPTTTLTFSAEVLREVTPSTGAIFFDNINRTTIKKAYVKLIPEGNKLLQVKKIESSGTSYLALASHKEGSSIVIEITIDGNKIPNEKCRGIDTICIHTAKTKSSPIKIAVQWELLTAFTANTAAKS